MPRGVHSESHTFIAFLFFRTDDFVASWSAYLTFLLLLRVQRLTGGQETGERVIFEKYGIGSTQSKLSENGQLRRFLKV